jgi:hypothetical protein
VRATDDRYRGEQAKFDLALRMIAHEARTGTIRYWTHLSDDRIRKLYGTYFKFDKTQGVRRRRGRSPTQIAPLVRNTSRALETGVLAHLLLEHGLVSIEAPPGPSLRGNIDLGHRFCECYETYGLLVSRPSLSFEWTWNLLLNIRRAEELALARCPDCSLGYVRDLLALPSEACPSCAVLMQS